MSARCELVAARLTCSVMSRSIRAAFESLALSISLTFWRADKIEQLANVSHWSQVTLLTLAKSAFSCLVALGKAVDR